MCLGICRVIGIFGRFYCGVVSHLLVKIRSRNYFTKQLIASPGLPPLSGQCKYREIGIGTIAGRPEIDPILEHALADRFDTGEIALLQPHDGARQRPATAPRVCSEQPWDYPPASRSSRLARVLLEQLEVHEQAPLELPELSDPRAERVVAMLRADPADRRPLAELASAAGASHRTIEHLFASEARMSFGRWRVRHRMITALEQLAHGDSVSNVAYAVGYETPSSFIAAFRASFGTTPTAYFQDTSPRRS